MCKLVLLIVMLMMLVTFVGCQQLWLSEEQVRGIVQEDVAKQIASIDVNDIVREEVASQLAGQQVKDIVGQEVAKQLAGIDILTVSRLLIKDKDGNLVAELGHFANGSAFLNLRSPDGKQITYLGLDSKGNGVLELNNSHGETVGALSCDPDGMMAWAFVSPMPGSACNSQAPAWFRLTFCDISASLTEGIYSLMPSRSAAAVVPPAVSSKAAMESPSCSG